MEKLISRKEAAKLLGISIATLDAARNSGLNFLCSVCAKWLRVLYRCWPSGVYRKMHPSCKASGKKALHTASCEVSELELFRILAGT